MVATSRLLPVPVVKVIEYFETFLFFHVVDPVPVSFWPPVESFPHEPAVILTSAVSTPEPPVAAEGVQPVVVPFAVKVWFAGAFFKPGLKVAAAVSFEQLCTGAAAAAGAAVSPALATARAITADTPNRLRFIQLPLPETTRGRKPRFPIGTRRPGLVNHGFRAAPSGGDMAETARTRNRPRRRILDAALTLASDGGYEALQVRAIAERAGVSSRTIYAQFPSLDSLLIVAVAEQSGELYRRLTESPLKGRSPAARVNSLISELTDTMTANRALTVALIRALLSGKPDVAQYVRGFREVLKTMLASAIAPDNPVKRDREVAEILECIWFTTLIAWASGTDVDGYIGDMMRRSTRLLLSAH